MIEVRALLMELGSSERRIVDLLHGARGPVTKGRIQGVYSHTPGPVSAVLCGVDGSPELVLGGRRYGRLAEIEIKPLRVGTFVGCYELSGPAGTERVRLRFGLRGGLRRLLDFNGPEEETSTDLLAFARETQLFVGSEADPEHAWLPVSGLDQLPPSRISSRRDSV